MKKNISKRKWLARLRIGKWIPGMVVHYYKFNPPPNYIMEQHPNMDFYRITQLAGL